MTVEYSIGKGEVESSILSGSTISTPYKLRLSGVPGVTVRWWYGTNLVVILLVTKIFLGVKVSQPATE